MAEEIIVRKIEIKTEGAEKALGKVDKAQSKVASSTGKLDGALGNLPGPLRAAQGGVKQLSMAFKALLANPIVLLIAGIVAGLVALFKAFKKTQAGGDKVADVMKGIGAAIEVVIEVAAKLFKALGKIFQGKFKEGFQDMGDAVDGMGKEMLDAAKAAADLEKNVRQLYEAETDVIVANAERRQQIAELVFATRDLTKSTEERKAAIIKADAIEKEILAENIALQQKRLAIAQQELENTPELQRTREQIRKVEEATAALIDLQTASLAKQRELKNRLNEIDSKAAAERKAEEAAELARQKAKNDLLAETRQNELDIEAKIKEDELSLEEDYLDSLNILDEEFEKDRIESSKAATKALVDNAKKRFREEDRLLQKQIENEYRLKDVKEGIYENTLDALTGFLGEGSKAAKAVAIADATRSAIKGAINAFQGALALPAPVGPILAPIAGAAALAAGMANVRKIAQTPDPVAAKAGGGGGGTSVPSISLAQPNTGGVNIEDIVQTDVGIGQDVNIVQDATSRRVTKAYVVQSEITASQDLERQREADVTL